MIVCHWWKWNHPNLDSTATASSRKWFEALNLNERSKLNQEVYCFCLIFDQIKKMDYCISNERFFLSLHHFLEPKMLQSSISQWILRKKLYTVNSKKSFISIVSFSTITSFSAQIILSDILSYDIFENNVGKTASVVWSFCRM